VLVDNENFHLGEKRFRHFVERWHLQSFRLEIRRQFDSRLEDLPAVLGVR
jgi:hypothetical protein